MIVERAKYLKNPIDDQIYIHIKKQAYNYFQTKGIHKFGNRSLFLRGVLLSAIAVFSYVSIVISSSYFLLQAYYLLLGVCLLALGMTLGHDAAHHSLTGNIKWDNVLFRIIFGLQGMNPSLWKIKHNSSHHPFPNISYMDSDLEITSLLRLSPYQKIRPMHRYQYLYAPLLYMFASLNWIFIYDFKMLFKFKHGNLYLKQTKAEKQNFIATKLIYISLFLIIPHFLSPFSFTTILVAFLVMHALLSLFISFTFFISHHVTHTHYVDLDKGSNIHTSWLIQQIASTVDFHPHNKYFNYIFGGFHAHVAHHLFPGVSHVHYPALTIMIRSVLKENNIPYHAITFFEGVKSHLKHLKNLGQA
jgi:linoleoyl-CoA desaturase